MPFSTANTAAVARFLPPGALDIFCKAANGAEQAEIDHNGCIRQGWAAVKSAGWGSPGHRQEMVSIIDPARHVLAKGRFPD